MTARNVSRRTVLLGGVTVLAAGVLPSIARTARGTSPAPDELHHRLRSLVSDESVRRLGQVRLESLPAATTGFSLARDVLPVGLDADSALAKSDDKLRSVFEDQIRTDYARGHVALVGGWVLSHTEAGLAALTAV